MAQVSEANNPIQRLLYLLDAAVPFDDSLTHQVISGIWKTNGSKDRILRIAGVLTRIPGEIRQAIDSLEIKDEKVDFEKEIHKPIYTIFGEGLLVGLGSKWKDLRSPLSGTHETMLRLLEPQVRSQAQTRPINLAEVVELLDQLNKIINEVVSAEMDDGLRHFCLKHLDIIRRSLEEALVLGPRPIATGFASVVGIYGMDIPRMQEMKDSAVGDRIWEFIQRISNLVTLWGATPLPANFQKFLE